MTDKHIRNSDEKVDVILGSYRGKNIERKGFWGRRNRWKIIYKQVMIDNVRFWLLKNILFFIVK
jgi:hypothetical protein